MDLVPGPFDPDARRNGRDWPAEADTMIGWKRLESLEMCVRDALSRKVAGDLVEAGVWRGGAAILMCSLLKALGDESRRVWVLDSFAGLPQPDAQTYPADANDRHWEFNAYLGVSLDQVKANFEKYNLLDDRVCFVQGWFKDTLPQAPVEHIAVLRADADMYESTAEVLENLYWKVSPGGYVIIDDYGAIVGCRNAVDDFRKRHGITEEIQRIDWTGIYWVRAE